MYFLYILFAILIFGILIMVHELGHFLTAKLFKVKVNEFSIFMGPAIWKRQRGETLYSLRCIPLGGYCAMEGEDENLSLIHISGSPYWPGRSAYQPEWRPGWVPGLSLIHI